MIVYIDEDEFWPIYYVKLPEQVSDYTKKYEEAFDIPDHILARYKETYAAFEDSWKEMRKIVTEQEEVHYQKKNNLNV